jgi:Spy/CpxP family protein refolding chaperone
LNKHQTTFGIVALVAAVALLVAPLSAAAATASGSPIDQALGDMNIYSPINQKKKAKAIRTKGPDFQTAQIKASTGRV